VQELGKAKLTLGYSILPSKKANPAILFTDNKLRTYRGPVEQSDQDEKIFPIRLGTW
jgi:hypothetical protein